MTQTIAVHSADAVEYSWATTITELTGEDITADTVEISLGSYDAPGVFTAPDVKTTGQTTVGDFNAAGGCGNNTVDLPDATILYQVIVQMLIGDIYKPAAGPYWVWTWLADNPEQIPRRGAKIIIT